MGDGGGSSSTSRPLTAEERRAAFDAGISGIISQLDPSMVERYQTGTTGGTTTTVNNPDWQQVYQPGGLPGVQFPVPRTIENGGLIQQTTGGQPEYGTRIRFGQYTPQEYQGMGNGDYNALEQSIIASRQAPLDHAWKVRSDQIAQDAADKGLWASGVPMQIQRREFDTNFTPAYLQAGAEAATQRYGLQSQDMAARNAFNQSEEQRRLDATYRPMDFLQGLYNGTGGVISSSSNSGGWSI